MYCSRCGTWVPAGAPVCPSCGTEQAGAPPSPPVRAVAAAAADVSPPAAAVAVRYGGFWRRFAAGCVDALVLFFPNAILRELSGLPSPLSLRPLPDDMLGRSLMMTAIMTLVTWWYCARLESSHWQGTLGQQLLGMRVTDLAGRRISFLRATARYFGQWLSLLLCGVGYLFNLWTSRRQTLHDIVAGCVIVRPNAAALHAAGTAAPTYAEQAP